MKAKSDRQTAKEKALQTLQIESIPEPCKELNDSQMLWAEVYFETLSNTKACKKAGYTKQYGSQLKKDARIRLYLNYLSEQTDSLQLLSKNQVVAKIGERILDNDIDNKDLASLVREARYIKGWGESASFNQQIVINLPDTYESFFASDKAKATEDDWQDVGPANEID